MSSSLMNSFLFLSIIFVRVCTAAKEQAILGKESGWMTGEKRMLETKRG